MAEVWIKSRQQVGELIEQHGGCLLVQVGDRLPEWFPKILCEVREQPDLPLDFPPIRPVKGGDRGIHSNTYPTYGGCVGQYLKKRRYYWRFSYYSIDGQLHHRHIRGGSVGKVSDAQATSVKRMIAEGKSIEAILEVL